MGTRTKQDLLNHMDQYKDAVIIIGPKALCYESYTDHESFQEVMTNKTLRRKPEVFWSFFKEHVYKGEERLSPAQEVLIELKDKIHRIYSQNTDGLLSNYLPVTYLHGRDDLYKCNSCKTKFTAEYVMSFDTPPECEVCGKPLRPDMLLIGENYWQDIFDDFKKDLLETHTVFLVGFDFEEDRIFDLILDYAEMKDTRNATEEEKRMLVTVGVDDLVDLEELANFEFLVKGDVGESMKRLLEK